ncbi:MAG: hypothetical protein HY423_03120 [Candidatus Lambdaproteobacteria bacterium]|nr:hypothetical protein [Candidatus Lambdaproteobacteria bacterium]
MESQHQKYNVPRRTLLAGLLAGLGVASLALGIGRGGPRRAAAAPAEEGPILYRRTPEVERYYRTLYR